MKDYEMYPETSGETQAFSGAPKDITFRLPKEGVEALIKIRDRETFETRVVRAIVSSKPEELPGADRLWIKDVTGVKELAFDHAWAIKVIEEVEEEDVEVQVVKKQPVGLGRSGSILKTLLERRSKEESDQ